jgi:hypothetical protein
MLPSSEEMRQKTCRLFHYSLLRSSNLSNRFQTGENRL